MFPTISHKDSSKQKYQQLNLSTSFNEYENVLYVNNGHNDTCLFGHNDDNYVCCTFFLIHNHAIFFCLINFYLSICSEPF